MNENFRAKEQLAILNTRSDIDNSIFTDGTIKNSNKEINENIISLSQEIK